jgi:hypothetical protein
MNFLRIIIFILLLCLALVSCIFAGVQIWLDQRPFLSWLGLLLASAAPLAYVIIRYSLKDHAQELHPMVFSCISGLGVAISMTASWKYGDSAGQIHIWSAGCLLAWILYLRTRPSLEGL